jgi:hypothetical protein
MRPPLAKGISVFPMAGVEPGVVIEAAEELGLDVADESGEVLR